MTATARRLKSVLTIMVLCFSAMAQAAATPDYTVTEAAAGFSFPWCIAFLPDGHWLVTERTGALKRVSEGGTRVTSVTGVPPVYVRSQGGLFDVLPDPAFASNRVIYLSYAHGTPDANALRVARAVLDGSKLRELEVIFEAQPTKDTPVHYGGRMVFLPDDTLLITTGDGFEYREAAQRLNNLLGKTVRINRDGSVPQGNPFATNPNARSEIWTYGHRNPQGIVVHPKTGSVYLHEHGPRGGDELNILQPGLNYGWPIVTHGVDYSGARITPYTVRDGLEQPLAYWVPSIAPAGMTVYSGNQFPAWQGDIFVAALVEQSVRRLRLDRKRVTEQEILFTELKQRIRDVRTGPDGCLYLLTDAPLTDDTSGRILAVCATDKTGG